MRKIFFTTYNVTFFSTFLVILALVFSSTNLTHASKIGVPPNFIPGTGLSNGLVGYWTFDGKDTPWTSSTAATTLDKSGNGNTGTLTNMAQATSPVAGKIGQGLSFDGSNDYVSAAVNLSGTNIASLSFWMKWNAYANDDDFAFEYTNNANAKNGIMIDPNESSTSKFVILMTKDSPQLYNGGSITRPSAGVWHHYGVILDRTTGSNNGVTVYVDGVVQSMTQTQSGGFGSNNFDNSSLYFMSRGGSSLFGAGSLDDVRVYNRALSATEVSQLYNTGISKFDVSPTKSLTSGLVGYWTFDGKDTPWTSSTAATTLDKSGNGNTGTLTNMAQATSPVAGKIGQGLSFDGSNDYVAIPTNVSLSGTQQASVSLWLNQPSYTLGSADIIFESTGDISAETVGFYLTSSDTTTGCSSNQIITAVRGDVGYNLQCYSPPTVNQWHHFVAVYDKADASSEGNLYIDGVLQSRTQSGLAANNTNNFGNKAFYIGARSGGTAPMQGKIDDVRIYNRVLSATEISQLYNMGR